jgi:hypothetical protein
VANHLKQYSTVSVFFGYDLKTKVHGHHAMEIALATDGLLAVHTSKTIKAEGVIIKPDTTHRITGNGLIISIFLDPETALCNDVMSLLGSKDVVKLEPAIAKVLMHHFENYTNRHFSEEGISELLAKTI